MALLEHTLTPEPTRKYIIEGVLRLLRRSFAIRRSPDAYRCAELHREEARRAVDRLF